jgi:DNA mismatch endonuclease, patch repair protein
MDNLDPATRRRTMSSVPSHNTSLELQVRRAVHTAGFRFRLQRKDLPGNPDLVFVQYRLAVFVHGCFWHGHDCLRGNRKPASNQSYWTKKLERNKQRDAETRAKLKALGWKTYVVWGCEIEKDTATLLQKLRRLRRNQQGS